MNNPRLLTGLLCAALWGGGPCAFGQESRVLTLDDIFLCAERHSAMLRPSLRAEEEARHDISIAGSMRLPDVSASLSLSYIGHRNGQGALGNGAAQPVVHRHHRTVRRIHEPQAD